jgi:hypothetical protein
VSNCQNSNSRLGDEGYPHCQALKNHCLTTQMISIFWS